ncbi:MAG: hypothetical protein F4187_03950 [Gemmatimonadetes bacterium]|nr:hypothetical protein [Acidobacteriota bacterium]MYG80961.1 hypothetical protein [Gemmatimonadota bacterium]
MSAPTPVDLAANVRARLEDAEWLETAGTPKVYGALDLAGAAERLQTPCLVSVALGEDVDDDLTPEGTETVLRVRTRIGVVIGAAARNDPGGIKGAAEDDGPLGTLLRAARTRLVGWTPARRWEPLAVRRGRLLSLEGGRVFWQDEYTTFGWAVQARS